MTISLQILIKTIVFNVIFLGVCGYWKISIIIKDGVDLNRVIIEEYALRTDYRGKLSDYHGIGQCIEPDCGDVLEYTIKTEREIITEIAFTITESACLPVKACATIAAELAKGKPVLEAYLITKEDIAKVTEGLEEEQEHCAQMAELALKRTIIDYSKRHKQ